MPKFSDSLKEKLNVYKILWKSLKTDQKVSLATMLALLVALPLATLATLTYTTFFSRANFPATPPTTPPTITPVTPPDSPTPSETVPTDSPTPYLSPTPTPIMVLNSATGKTCANLCKELNLTCQSVGTDALATNGKRWVASGNTCSQGNAGCATEMKKTSNRSCSGNQQPWTYCRCK